MTSNDPSAAQGYDPTLSATERRALILVGQLANEAQELRIALDQANRWLDAFATMHATWGTLGGDPEKVENELHAIWERMRRMIQAREDGLGEVGAV